MSTDEATRMVETLLSLKREDVITAEEVKSALKKIEYYKDVLAE